MLANSGYWPLVTLVGAAIYFDAAVRELAKFLCFKHEGTRMDSASQHKFFFSTYFIMLGLAGVSGYYAVVHF